MNDRDLGHLLQQLQNGERDVHSVVQELRKAAFSDLGFARVDHQRGVRQGVAEVILAAPKTAEQIVAIALELANRKNNVLMTRLDAAKASEVMKSLPELCYDEVSRTGFLQVVTIPSRSANVVIVTAGTGDLPVAQEAAGTLRALGITPEVLVDVGVAGIHRLMAYADALMRAEAIIVVAGMEGALASVIGGLVRCPVIAVPTSVGYGAHLGGLTPLFAMLSSCAAGVVVVNIDNGFGAAMAAFRIVANNHEVTKQ